jgi:regulator of replication initiation timing
VSDHPFHAGSSWELDIVELRAELRAAVESLETQNKQLRAEVERLRSMLAPERTSHAVVICCFRKKKEMKAENKRLRALLERWLTVTAWSGSVLAEETRRGLANTATS